MSDQQYRDENGTVWYVNIVDVSDLPDLFASTVHEWLDTDIDPWAKDGKAGSMYYPLTAEDEEQLEARVDTLKNGIGVMPSVRTHGRRSLHND